MVEVALTVDPFRWSDDVLSSEILARDTHDVVVHEPRDADEERSRENAGDGDSCRPKVDAASGVQGPTDGDISTESHDDRQPSTAEHEDVDQTLFVRVVVETGHPVVMAKTTTTATTRRHDDVSTCQSLTSSSTSL